MKKKTMMGKLASLLFALALVWGGVACTQPETPAPTTYTITFDSGVESISVEEGAVAKEPTKPTKDGYEFIEWLNGTEAYDWALPVTSNLSLTAKWSAIKYTITYLPEGVKTDNPTTYTIESETITLTEPTLEEGKYFIAWHVYTEEGEVETGIAKGSTGNKTFYAEISSEKPCVVTFNDGTKKLTSVNTKKDSKVTLPTGYEKKYNFFSDKECKKAFDITTPITADTTIYVKVKTFTVTFDSGVEAVTVEYEGTVKEPTAPTNGDKVFVGWYDGDNKFDFTTKITKDITLKAKWEEKKVEEIPSVVKVTKDGDVYSFADGTYQFITEDSVILKFSMPEEVVCAEGYQLKLSGAIDFGETPIYQQLHIRTYDNNNIPLFGADCNMVTSWEAGFSGITPVNAVVKIPADGYSFKDCIFVLGGPLEGVKEPGTINVTLKDVKLTYEKIDENAGVDLSFKCEVLQWGKQGTCKFTLPEPITVAAGDSYIFTGDIEFGEPSSGKIVQISIQETKTYSVVETYGIIQDYDKGLAGTNKSFTATWNIPEKAAFYGEHTDVQFVLEWDKDAVGSELCSIKLKNFKITKK